MDKKKISHQELLQLKRWNTPTLYNGWEQITNNDITKDVFNTEETRDFMPQMGPMIGYAVTVVFEPSKKEHTKVEDAWNKYYEYVASIDGQKIVVVQDLDKPNVVGSFWGEVNSNIHKALGCVGTITDGAIRDVDEIINAGFKAIAKRTCIGHAYSIPVRWNCEVEVFGCKIEPNQLIHADKHGIFAIPKEDEKGLLEASIFMDNNECNTVIAAAKNYAGKSLQEILESLNKAKLDFSKAVKKKYGKRGEW